MRNDIPGLGAEGVQSAITTCHIVLDKLRETYDIVPVASLLFPPKDPRVEAALQEMAQKAHACCAFASVQSIRILCHYGSNGAIRLLAA
eukprot:3731835-Amphidinium_carterae.3